MARRSAPPRPRASMPGMEAVVEADLDAPARALGRRARPRRPARAPIPAGFSTSTCAPASSAAIAMLGELVVGGGDDDHVGLAARAAVERRRRVAAVPAAERVGRVGSTSKQATSSSSAERLGALAADQAAADDADPQRRRLLADRALEVEVEAQLLHARRAHRLARVVGPRRVDEQEAAAARADELAADARRSGARACRGGRCSRWPSPASARACSPSARASARRSARGRRTRAARGSRRPSAWCGAGSSSISSSLLARAPVLVGQQRARRARLAGVEEQEVARHPVAASRRDERAAARRRRVPSGLNV